MVRNVAIKTPHKLHNPLRRLKGEVERAERLSHLSRQTLSIS